MTDLTKRAEAWQERFERAAPFRSTLEHDAHKIISDQQARIAELEAENAKLREDHARLNCISDEYWDLRCFEIPTGAGDADVGWRVIEHHMAAPQERVIAEVYRDDLRAAIDAAMAERGAWS